MSDWWAGAARLSSQNVRLGERFADVMEEFSTTFLPPPRRELITFQFSEILASTCAILSQKQILCNMSEAFDKFDARLRRQFWWRKQSCCWIPANIAAQTKFIEKRGLYARHGRASRFLQKHRMSETARPPNLRPIEILLFTLSSQSIEQHWATPDGERHWSARSESLNPAIVSPAIYLSSKFHLIYHHPDCPRAGFVILITRYMNLKLAEDDLLRNVAHSFVLFLFL